ncbi:MAG: hypothetical protein CMF24_08715 [Ilumatobacter sp.]|nr:hypothetical protein [Ilumatobacter sp.]
MLTFFAFARPAVFIRWDFEFDAMYFGVEHCAGKQVLRFPSAQHVVVIHELDVFIFRFENKHV